MKRQILDLIREKAEATALAMKDELVEVNTRTSPDSLHIEVVIYNANGVSLDHCAAFSRALDEKIDDLDISDGPYYLEVASPGLDRPIESDDDLRRNLGKKVEVKLYKKLNNQKEFIGEIKDYSEKEITLTTEDGEEKIPRDIISLMRQVISF